MEKTGEMVLLKQENEELKEEVKTLYRTVETMQHSMNLLLDRYVTGESR